MLSFGDTRPRRRPSLTPMIDVVFLLLVFFMLAARFGQSGALPLGAAGSGAAYEGPPRLVTVESAGLRLNGVAFDEADLLRELGLLTSDPADLVVLRASEGTDVQRLVDVLDLLRAAGFTGLVLAE